MIKYLKQLFLLLILILFACCEPGDAPSSFKMGNPYAKDFAGIKGPVKSAIYSFYKKGYVYKATRLDYSTEGVLLKMKAIESNDSVVFTYDYDPNNNIQDVNGTGITFYKNEYKKGNLAKEWFFTDKKKKEGYTFRYKTQGETLIKKENDIATGAGITTTFIYNSKGIVLEKQRMVNDGSYTLNTYDDDGHLISITHYSPEDEVRYREDITCKYDKYDNCIRYSAKRGKKVVEYYKVKYKYYTEKELKDVKKQSESAVTNKTISDEDPSEPEAPTSALMTTIVILTLLLFAFYIFLANKYRHLFHNFGGKVRRDGMRRMWMYNSEPYVKMSTIFIAGISAFLSSIILLLLVGGITWMVFGLVNLSLLAIILIGWVMLIGGVFLLFFKKIYGILAIIIGAIIIHYRDLLEHCGRKFADWGGSFLDNVNAFSWTISIFTNYGRDILLAIVIPIGCFLSLAVLLIIISLLLRMLEYVSLQIYNVHRPCPYCGNTKDFTYMVNGEEYPIPLRPGLYGILHQTNHHTGARVPTMLMNGKAKLTRKCPHCGKLVNTNEEKTYGTDIHIGIVGARSSGKTYMLFSALETLTQKLGKDFYQIDADSSNEMTTIIERIHKHEGIQTAVKSRYKAIQFRLNRKHRPLPYHLFFYDVAGEKFSANATKTLSALEFYTRVRTILFVIDPSMMDIQKASPSAAFAQWYQQHGNPNEEYDLEETLATLQEILAQVGRKAHDIDLIVTCTKKDLGYLQNSNYPYDCTEPQLKRFVNEELGLHNLDNAICNEFKTVGYAAVSALDKDDPALGDLFGSMLM